MTQPTTKRPRISPLALVLLLSAVFFALFLIVSGAMFMKKLPGSAGKGSSAAIFGEGSVGVLELKGVIMDSKKILTRLERFEEDEGIKAVVLRINSPGGSVAPSQEIYQAVKAYSKPLVVSMGSVAASGGYYVSLGAKKVYANPGTITGSIGVIMEFVNLGKLYEWAKIHRYALKTGQYKGAGAEYRDLTPEERALLQEMIDGVLVQFKEAVVAGRGLPMEKVDAIADGRILSGAQAKALKLVDEVGTLQDAVNEAGKMAGLKGKPDVVYYEKPRSRWLEFLLGDAMDDDEESAESRAGLAGALRALLGVPTPGLRTIEENLTGLSPGVYWLWTGSR